MIKFNLFKEIVVVDKSELLNVIDSKEQFGIDVNGKIKKEPFGLNDVLIFSGTGSESSIAQTLKKDYLVVEDGQRVLIKAFGAWQNIINMNAKRATYNDTTSDGVDEFSTKEMEEIVWHANEFNITYRVLVDVLEQECDGVLICIEQDNPYQFSGLGFVENLTHAKEILFDFCKKKIIDLLDEADEFKKKSLTQDEKKAALYFQISL